MTPPSHQSNTIRRTWLMGMAALGATSVAVAAKPAAIAVRINMKTIKQIVATAALAMGVILPMSGAAQATMDHGKMEMAEASMTDGEVKKVAVDAGKVTIKHGHIQHLDMPGMTMVFTAKDKAMLANLKPGDKIRFMVEMDGSKMMVTDIQSAN